MASRRSAETWGLFRNPDADPEAEVELETYPRVALTVIAGAPNVTPVTPITKGTA